MDPLDSFLDITLAQPKPKKPQGKLRFLLKHLEGHDYSLEMDHSSLTDVMCCSRAAEFKMVHKRSTYPGPALTYGSAIHAALELWYRSGAVFSESMFNMMLTTAEEVLLQNPPPADEWRTFDHLRTALARYLKKYDKEPFSILRHEEKPCVEMSFAVPLTVLDVNAMCPYPRSMIVRDAVEDTPFQIDRVHVTWTGIIDLVVSQLQEAWIVDHKTASRTGSSFFRGYDLSQQMVGYVWALRKLMPDVPISGVILNVIIGRKPTEKGKGQAWDLERDTKRYPDAQVDEWPLSIIALISDLIHKLMSGFFPMETTWCTNKFGSCPWLDVCSLFDKRERDILLYSDAYAPNVWNPIDGGEA